VKASVKAGAAASKASSKGKKNAAATMTAAAAAEARVIAAVDIVGAETSKRHAAVEKVISRLKERRNAFFVFGVNSVDFN
jgi:hypothetical protein